MKKLSAIIALLLCVTIGGVYATWTYAGTNDIADAFVEAKASIEGFEFTVANGTYKVESNLVLSVDQKAADDHTAVLVFKSNDSKAIHLTVTFTPAENAPADIKANAVPSQLYFGTTSTMQYTMDAEGNYSANGTATDIFKFKDGATSSFTANITWEEQTDGSFTYSMDEAALKEQIQLNDTFVLDIKSEYDAFGTALSGNIIAKVTDGTVSQ